MVPHKKGNFFPLCSAGYYKFEGRDCASLPALLMCLITVNSGIK